MVRALQSLAVAAGALTMGSSLEVPTASNRWAVIAAGSSGFMNYRHQADACHSYQLMRKSGIPESNIIVMMQDDVANDSENPFPGKLYNKPAHSNPVDVYDGCKIDYKGDIVTADLFLKVITGDDSNLPSSGSGKVLKSTATDRVFLNFVDHGGVGIVAFPNGPVLHVEDLSKALKTMQKKDMFKELVFYMEACESGSMFPDLTKSGNIFAVTASNADESSWGFYCSPDDVVEGKHVGSCLGDLFSIAWMEDSDSGKFASETIKTQVTRVTKRTNKSHVTTFGDLDIESDTIGQFEVAEALKASVPAMMEGSAYDVRDIPLHTSYWRWSHAQTAQEKAREWAKLQRVVHNRKADEVTFDSLKNTVCQGLQGCTEQMTHSKLALKDYACHKTLATIVHNSCPAREERNPGGWNGFNMRFSQTLVNICESRALLKKETQELSEIVHAECHKARQAAAAAQEHNMVVV